MSKGVVIIIEKEGKILFLREANGPFAGYWSTAKGVVKEGETPEQAVVRKAKIETGLSVTPDKMVFTEKADTKVDELEFWTTKNVTGKLNINHQDATDHAWLTVGEALTKNLIPATKSYLMSKQNEK